MIKRNTRNINASRRSDMIFYTLIILLPLLQFSIFYIGVNIRSVLFSFQEFESDGLTYGYKFIDGNIFKNFADAFTNLFTTPMMRKTIENSAFLYVFGLVVNLPLSLFFSFYIMKKFPASKIFRVILFLPSIICAVVLVYIYEVFADRLYPEIIRLFVGKEGFSFAEHQLLANSDTRFTALAIYHFFFAFGTSTLMYSSAMSGVSTEIIEAAHVDGISEFGEFIHIILPSVFPTLTTFLVVGVSGFFTNQFGLVEFYSGGADFSVWTLGYYLYKETVLNGQGKELYPYLSAMGISFTLIAAPITFLVKHLLEKYGPSEN